LASLLVKKGHQVRVVMTQGAQKFITPLTMQTLSKNPVTTDVFAEQEGWCPGHIELADDADLLLVAPASASALARLAKATQATKPKRPTQPMPRPTLPRATLRAPVTALADEAPAAETKAKKGKKSKKGDSEPQFTPDGKSVLFVSSRSGSSQLWLMPFDGGEPRQLTDFAPGLSGPVFSRDGRYIAAATELWPKIGIDAEKHKAFEAEREAGKLNVHVSDKLMYRHWTDWEDGKLSQILLIEAQSGKVLKNLTPVPFDAPTWSVGGGRGYAFSADGRSLYYNCNHDDRSVPTPCPPCRCRGRPSARWPSSWLHTLPSAYASGCCCLAHACRRCVNAHAAMR
jgi:hypothetical protein